jgi:hypothetical protein
MRTDIEERVSIVRQVFPSWSVDIPTTFDEAFLTGPDHWHAWDVDRSVSLSSFLLTDDHGPVPAQQILEQVPPPAGTPIEVLRRGLVGWAVEVEADPSARASRALSGMLAADGKVLLVTIASDDPQWSRRTWSSIRCLGVSFAAAASVTG